MDRDRFSFVRMTHTDAGVPLSPMRKNRADVSLMRDSQSRFFGKEETDVRIQRVFDFTFRKEI